MRVFALYNILIREGQILGADNGISLERFDGQAAKDPSDATIRDRVATAAREMGDLLRHKDAKRALEIFTIEASSVSAK